jgi:hypothetical protein
MSDRDDPPGPPDNPFGAQPPDNPFGAPPPDNPFGAPPSSDPFGRGARPDDPFGPAPTDDPFGPAPSGGPAAPAPPNEAWRQPQPMPHDPFAAPPPVAGSTNAEGAIAALVLGIVGVIFCPLCAPFAWFYGRRAEQLVDASGGVLAGRGEATAGKILGIVMCALMILGVILLIVLFGLGASYSSSTDGGSGGGSSFEVGTPQ